MPSDTGGAVWASNALFLDCLFGRFSGATGRSEVAIAAASRTLFLGLPRLGFSGSDDTIGTAKVGSVGFATS